VGWAAGGLALAALVAGGTIAQAGQGPFGGRHGKHHGFRGPGGGFHGVRMLKEVGLSEEQRAQIRTVLQAEREAGQDQREQARAARRELHEAIHDGAEEHVLRDKATNLGVLTGDMAVRAVGIRNQIHGILTEEQALKLEQLRAERQQEMEKRQERMKQRMEKMREMMGDEMPFPDFLER
jgi:protein CpxP